MKVYSAPQVVKISIDPKEAFARYEVNCCEPTSTNPDPCPQDQAETMANLGAQSCTIFSQYCP